MKNLSLIILNLAIVTLLCTCQQPQAPEPTGNLVLNFAFADQGPITVLFQKLAGRSSCADFDSARCKVMQNSEVVWDNALPRVGDEFKAEITLDKGTGYTVQAQTYINQVLCYSGTSSEFRIDGGENTSVTVAMTPQIPVVPSSLYASSVSASQINLLWQDNSTNEEGFKIERKTGSIGSWSQIAIASQNTSAYLNTGLDPGTTYYYRIRAFNGAGNSLYSVEDNATTVQVPPIAPTNLYAAAVSSSRIDLAWDDNSSNETGYKIERKTGSSGTYSEIADIGQNSTSYQNTGLSPGTTYYYHIRAYNSAGNSNYSNEANANTALTVPIAPSNLVATTLDTSRINLTWSDNSSNETGFIIERKIGLSGTWSHIDTVGQNFHNYQDPGLIEGTDYYYRVRAYNYVGNSNFSNLSNASTYLISPSNLIAITVDSSQINLSWDDNSSKESGFKVERKTGISGTWSLIDSVVTDVKSFQSAGLTPGTSYFYRIKAYNSTSISDYSNEAFATTIQCIPLAPSILTATTAWLIQINLGWDDNSTNEDGFKIERKTGSSGVWSQIDSVGQNIEAHQDTTLNPETTYYYRVRAYNIIGNSSYSNMDSATTFSEIAGMVLIPAGSFIMGSALVGGSSSPEHLVTLSTYYIDKYAVTNAQFKDYCDATGHDYPPDPDFSGMSNYFTNSIYANYPVVNVSWLDADSFATWTGKRLPTEAEWERAAKGGQDNRYWPWGYSFGTNNANIIGSGDGYMHTSPVGTFPTGVSPAGCFDMAGNVWEWCHDWWASYSSNPQTDPQGPQSGTLKVSRGGSWAGSNGEAKCAFRNYVNPTVLNNSYGFRCARTP